MENVQIDEQEYIILDSGICLEFIENVHSFLKELYQK